MFNRDDIGCQDATFSPSTSAARPALYFYDTEGALVSAESLVDLTGDLEIGEDGALTVRTEMEPLGVLTIATHGRGALVSGSVRVIADEPIGGVLRFDLPGIGVAGVGASSPVRDALFPVRRQEGGINTGVAVHNLGEEVMEVTCELMKGGTVLDDVSIPLAANGQSSWFINEVFTGADTSDFAGSVRCTAPGRGCSPEWPWNWMPPTGSSPPFLWCRFQRGRIRNRRRAGWTPTTGNTPGRIGLGMRFQGFLAGIVE